MMYFLLILGFICLVKGADFFVDGCASIAKMLRVPSVIIGLTIVAFGTSAPEASVSIMASLSGNNDIAISNVIGSNVFNSLVVLGICGLILPLTVQAGICKKELPFSIGMTALLILFCGFFPNGKNAPLQIGRLEGLILLLFFGLFLYQQIHSALKNRNIRPEEDQIGKKFSPAVSILMSIAGVIMIILGGDLVVNSASDIAAAFGMSQTLIGLTIVAMGTSLPELVTSIVASSKGENDLAVGNVVGSNIFNILLIIGASASISPMTIHRVSVYDGIFLLVMSLLLFLFVFRDKKISRIQAGILVISYVCYSAYIILR
ncbi:MAG: calcium/sodium antiporter [Blautia sp.]